MALVTSLGAQATPVTVSFSFAGDTELGNSPQVPTNPTSYMASVKSALAADVVFANLEGTMTAGGTSKCAHPSSSCYAFKVPTSFAQAYKATGFTILNSANNHSFDFGSAGAASTTAALHAAGILQAGLRNQITYERIGTVKVAVIGFAPYFNRSIAYSKSQGECSISHCLHAHWRGRSGRDARNQEDRNFLRRESGQSLSVRTLRD